MNTSRLALTLATSISLLSGCGGGGGSSSGGTTQPTNPGTNPDDSKQLVFEYAAQPLHPRAFNLSASSGEPENHFSPGDTLSLIWDIDMYYSDSTTLDEGERHLYDANVYLSTDDQIQDEDLKLFNIECSVPATSQHSCSDVASFQCVYAMDNNNTMSCTSIPLSRPLGITDEVVDTSTWLATIPREANVIFQACLKDDPDKCVSATYPIQLN